MESNSADMETDYSSWRFEFNEFIYVAQTKTFIWSQSPEQGSSFSYSRVDYFFVNNASLNVVTKR